jgi:hypothetical protein
LRNRNTIFLTFLYNFTVQDSFGIAVIHLRLKMPMKWWNKNQLFLVYLEAFSSSKLIIVLINEKIMSLLRVFSVENKRRKLLWEFLLILKRIVIWENSWDSNLRIRPGQSFKVCLNICIYFRATYVVVIKIDFIFP